MREAKDAFFWMNGRLATGLIKVTSNPSEIDDGFWALSISYSGEWIAAKFGEVIDAPWESAEKFIPVTSNWESSLDKDQYISYVERIQEEIALGWVYQVNACRVISAALPENFSMPGLFTQIIKNNPAPFASFLQIPGYEIASASPELFLERRGSHLLSSPIKGTKPTGAPEFGQKDRAENVMIVDLIRNDLGKVCDDGSIDVPRLLADEEHPGIDHLVSDVVGTLKAGLTWQEILTPLLPPGSISGAPKSSAVDLIEENENFSRGPYCGALGYIDEDRAQLSVAIRIFWRTANQIHFGTGAGITWGSVPSDEWEETELKARRLISIAEGKSL